MDLPLESTAALVVATLGGAAIGLEREWSGHAKGAHARFGGIRTFTLLGVLSGLAGWMTAGPLMPLAVVILAGAAAVIVIGYHAASRADVDATTEVAALVVLAAGAAAGAGYLALTSAVVAATALLLIEKTRLHALVQRLDDAALRASARFAAMACIVLPLLPQGPYGPLNAIRPRELWALVLFFSGLGFLGWIARRLVGANQGAIVAGLLGGILSSTSVTLQFARDSRATAIPPRALAAGAIGASTVMLARVMFACAVLNPALAVTLPPYLLPAGIVGCAAVFVIWRVDGEDAAQAEINDSPLNLRAALQMTVLFQAVLFLVILVQARWGASALVATSAFVGLTDLDALTFSLARGAAPAGALATVTTALVTGVLANTLLKLAVALVVGTGAFRLLAGGALATMAVSVAAVLWIGTF